MTAHCGGFTRLCLFFKILFIFREKGREGGRKGEKHQHVVASRAPPTGELAHNPGMCPDWESTGDPLVCRLALKPLSHTSQGCLSLEHVQHYSFSETSDICPVGTLPGENASCPVQAVFPGCPGPLEGGSHSSAGHAWNGCGLGVGLPPCLSPGLQASTPGCSLT